MKRKFKFKLSVWQVLALGYLICILIGSALLSLPFASKDGHSAGYLNALFVSTSATCVTGLTPVDTSTQWSYFGQIVILILIQLGGLGFMTFVSVLFQIFKRGMGLYGRTLVMMSAGDKKYNGIARLIRRIIIGTAIIELTGAALLSIRFIQDYGALKGIYYGIWHSVSAFCNAGFDVLGIGGTSLSAYATDPLVTLTICALIILGGLGFCVWGDVLDCKCNPKKFQLNTKIVLLMTAILLVLATGLFMAFEWNNYSEYNFGEKLLMSIFNATTPRTAGFFTTAPANLSESGYLLTIILMFIGGSSGSTAGGIKVGTFAVIIMGMLTVFRGRKDINIGKKRIDSALVSQALAIFAAFLMLVMVATLIICAVEEPSLEGKCTFKDALFECVSALGTSGLSASKEFGSLTPHLSVVSKLILILLMYAGRVGILTLALALGKKRKVDNIRRPLDSLMIG